EAALESLFEAALESLFEATLESLFAAFDDSGFATLLEGSCFESLAPGFERCGIVEGRGLEQLLGREATGRIGQGSNGLGAAKRGKPFLARKAHVDRQLAHTLSQDAELLEGDAVALRVPRLDVRPSQQ